ncbi:hypothetical protein ABZZ79_15630 [Streptomyces sp. NPDC006458]|uniref:hypothetical protein n=1 Tax=Streptomyces sp. NPDC006458 TaxID=3154302 RepID=UPI0033A58AC7
MSARHSARSQNRRLFLATGLVAVAALLRLTSPDGGADEGPEPERGPSTVSSVPTRRSAPSAGDPAPSRTTRPASPSPSPSGSRSTADPDPGTTAPKSGTSPSRSYPDPPRTPPQQYDPAGP